VLVLQFLSLLLVSLYPSLVHPYTLSSRVVCIYLSFPCTFLSLSKRSPSPSLTHSHTHTHTHTHTLSLSFFLAQISTGRQSRHSLRCCCTARGCIHFGRCVGVGVFLCVCVCVCVCAHSLHSCTICCYITLEGVCVHTRVCVCAGTRACVYMHVCVCMSVVLVRASLPLLRRDTYTRTNTGSWPP